MGEYTAIHEAANGVVELLRNKMTPAPISKPELIGLGSPFEPGDFQLTIYIYQIAQENYGAVPSGSFIQEGKTSQRLAPLPITLSLLITAHSKAPIQTRTADEYRILGRAVQVLRDNPQLSGDSLTGSLQNITEDLHIVLEKTIPIDQYNKIWSGSNKPYKLSIACKIETILIDSERVRTVSRVKSIRINTKESDK